VIAASAAGVLVACGGSAKDDGTGAEKTADAGCVFGECPPTDVPADPYDFCSRLSSTRSDCPVRWPPALGAALPDCDSGDTLHEDCQVSSTHCGLRTLQLYVDTIPVSSVTLWTFCFYDENSEQLVGVTHTATLLDCEALGAVFPPAGFWRGACGPGSVDVRPN